MNWFWHAMWISLLVIPTTILWLVCVYDIVFRHHEQAWWMRVAWLIGVLAFPIIGAFVYIGIYGSGIGLESDRQNFDGSSMAGRHTDAGFEAQRQRLSTQK